MALGNQILWMGASNGEQMNTQIYSGKKTLLFYYYLESTHSNLLGWRTKSKIVRLQIHFKRTCAASQVMSVYVSFFKTSVSLISIYIMGVMYIDMRKHITRCQESFLPKPVVSRFFFFLKTSYRCFLGSRHSLFFLSSSLMTSKDTCEGRFPLSSWLFL